MLQMRPGRARWMRHWTELARPVRRFWLLAEPP